MCHQQERRPKSGLQRPKKDVHKRGAAKKVDVVSYRGERPRQACIHVARSRSGDAVAGAMPAAGKPKGASESALAAGRPAAPARTQPRRPYVAGMDVRTLTGVEIGANMCVVAATLATRTTAVDSDYVDMHRDVRSNCFAYCFAYTLRCVSRKLDVNVLRQRRLVG